MGRLVKNRELYNGALTVKIPNVTTSQRPAGQNGDIIYNTTTGTFQMYDNGWGNMSTANSGLGTVTVDKFQGDGSTTTFGGGLGNTLDGSTAANLSFNVANDEDVVVFIGGIYQTPTTNYQIVGGGTQIQFGSAPDPIDDNGNVNVIAVIHGLNKLGE
jgi:hypothetical protein